MNRRRRLPSQSDCRALEHRLLCRLVMNGEFAITAPGGGEAYTAIILRPSEGVLGSSTVPAR
jgi:hypothetical protein